MSRPSKCVTSIDSKKHKVICQIFTDNYYAGICTDVYADDRFFYLYQDMDSQVMIPHVCLDEVIKELKKLQRKIKK